MSQNTIAERRFSADDQEWFAALSGDRNPMHMDAVVARRTMAGFPVVHGVHTLLWSLDALYREVAGLPQPTAITARFEKMIHVTDHVQLRLAERGEKRLRLDVAVEGTIAARVNLLFERAQQTETSGTEASESRPSTPRDLTFEQARSDKGCFSLSASSNELAQAFPVAAAVFGAERLAWLAGTSFLVGMVCPGLHSIYNSLNVALNDAAPPGVLCYRVTKSDPRFRLVTMDVGGGGWTGTVEAFVRPPPMAQPGMAEITAQTTPGEFNGVRALVVGGTRGVGEVIAKILASGGAQVLITYASGEQEANRLQTEIRSAGGRCDVLRYDVLSDAPAQLASLQIVPNQIFYLATPPIFRRRVVGFSSARFEDFFAFYVTGFYRLCHALPSAKQAAIFYPSSVSIETRPANMTEYTMAKAAGEILCADMQRFEGFGDILVRRLPRLPTDQTATLSQVASADPIAVILPLVREMIAIDRS